jgi:hypothetical protein
VLTWSLFRANGVPTLKECSVKLESVGAVVRRGEWGQVEVAAPARLLREPGWAQTNEMALRKELARAAETLTLASPVVLAAVERAEREKRPLSEVLEDAVPSIGGGC